MSYSTLALVVAACWLSIGLTLALVMGRRGHDAFTWLILGALFGPLSAIFAVQARRDERLGAELIADRRSNGPGPVDVLAGIDGSPASRAALRAAVEILGGRLGRLTIATVIPYDCGPDRQRTATALLEHEAEAIGDGPRVELLHGRPGPALLERTITDGYDLLVIGARGAGASKGVLGSTAVDVAESAKVPVLLMGDSAASPGGR